MKLAVDLVTFYHPAFWDLTDEKKIAIVANEHPQRFWSRLFDTVSKAGITGLELTFSPFDPESLVKAFGSVENILRELEKRQLSVISGFFADLAMTIDSSDAAMLTHHGNAVKMARTLKALGCDTLVVAAPLRPNWDCEPTFISDLSYFEGLAGFFNRLGVDLDMLGLRLCIHNEAHSTFATARDIDCLMLLTDPAHVGFCPDVGHLILAGADPIQTCSRHRERIVLAHWKDASGRAPDRIPLDVDIHASHRPFFSPLGEGVVDWPRWVEVLQSGKFDGWNVLEIDASPDPMRDICASRMFATKVFGADAR